MINHYKKINLTTKQQLEFIDITEDVKEVVEESGAKKGQAVIFSPHTTASIVINHNEPLLLQDLGRILYGIAPIDERYNHDIFELSKKNSSDGRSNGHSHCKNVILGCNQNLVIENGELLLGERQSIFFTELDGGRKRDYIVQVIGE